MAPSCASILIADDCANDRLLIRKAFEAVAPDASLEFVHDGQEAIEYLVSNPPPDLLVLDVRMTRLNGFGVLKWIQEDDSLKTLPVVIMSGSRMADGEGQAVKLGARAYFAKPFEFAAMKALAKTMLRYILEPSVTELT